MYITRDYLKQCLPVICVISNPVRFKSRYKLYDRFAKYVKDSGGLLITVECAFGDRHHALDFGETQHGQEIHGTAPTKETEYHKARTTEHHIYIKVRSSSEIWLKENLINIGISRIPFEWEKCAVVDADVIFANTNWVGDTLHALENYKVVQMFAEAQDLDPNNNTVGKLSKSFMWCYKNGYDKTTPSVPMPPGTYIQQPVAKKGTPVPAGVQMWHPGYAWAFRRDALNDLGGLVDFAIMGAADNHMAHALIGKVELSYHPHVHPVYAQKLLEWEFRAEKLIRRDVGYVEGLLLHYWHGRKVDRKYWDRWKVIVDNKYNPDLDLKLDWQGVYQLVDRGDERSIALRDGAKRYFRERNEDSIDVVAPA